MHHCNYILCNHSLYKQVEIHLSHMCYGMYCNPNLLVYKRGEGDPFEYVLIVVHHTSHVVYVICTHMIVTLLGDGA